MKSLILLLVAFLHLTWCFSQTNGSVKGTVVDANKKTISSANLMLHRAADSVFVKANLTLEDGQFEFENLSDGTYFITVSHASFDVYSSGNFTISLENQNVILKEISLTSTSTTLQEVKVANAPKPFVERKLDKLVVNVESSALSAGNTVLEVLERAPGVMVNQETSINLKGKSGVIVMIDGKPSPLSGTELITFLKGIPASNIQTIEIITNPSARYDAAGNAGIINIKFKKDQREGFNGSLTLTYGQGIYPKPSASTNLNYRVKKWNFFGSHSYSQPKNFTNFFINRKFFEPNGDLNSTFEQISFTKHSISSNNSRLGVDFFSSDKTVFGVLFNGNWNDQSRNGNTNATITNPNGILDYTTQTSILLNENRFNGFANLNFKHTFNAGKELTADFDMGSFDATSIQDIENINSNPDGSLISANKLATDQTGTIKVQSIKADYLHSFSEKTKMEIGAKSSWVTSDNEVKFFDVINNQNQLDPERSNHFIYDENINALYTSFSKEFTKWDLQCGLRVEHTDTNGEQLATNESFSRNYVNLFPNVVVNRKFSETNSLSLSYAKRIDRPTYRQLNPFKVFVDSYTYVVGDPTLNSVITHLLELNHTFKGKYVTTVSYSKSKESITDIFVQDDVTRISYQIPANIQDFEQYNLGIYVPFNYKKILNSTLSGSVYLNQYSSPLQGGNLEQDFTSWDVNLSNSFALGNGWTAELNGYYQSKMVWGLFYIKDLAQITTGIQKISKDKNSTFKFSVTDLFQTNHIAVVVDYQNQDFFTDRTWDSRVASLSYTYRFGKNTVARARQRNTGVEDEKRRAG